MHLPIYLPFLVHRTLVLSRVVATRDTSLFETVVVRLAICATNPGILQFPLTTSFTHTLGCVTLGLRIPNLRRSLHISLRVFSLQFGSIITFFASWHLAILFTPVLCVHCGDLFGGEEGTTYSTRMSHRAILYWYLKGELAALSVASECIIVQRGHLAPTTLLCQFHACHVFINCRLSMLFVDVDRKIVSLVFSSEHRITMLTRCDFS